MFGGSDEEEDRESGEEKVREFSRFCQEVGLRDGTGTRLWIRRRLWRRRWLGHVSGAREIGSMMIGEMRGGRRRLGW